MKRLGVLISLLALLAIPASAQIFNVNNPGGSGGAGGGSPVTTPSFTAVGGTGTLGATSTNGRTWSSTTLPNAAGTDWAAVAWSGSIFAAVSGGSGGGLSTVAASSLDGTTWAARTLSQHGWSGLSYGGGRFCTVANDGAVASFSTDGLTWTSSFPTLGSWISVAYGGTANVFAATNNGGGGINTSPDCSTWTNRASFSFGSSSAIAANSAGFCDVLNSGTTATSPDGTTWTSHGAAFAGGTFKSNSLTYSTRLGKYVLVDAGASSNGTSSWTSSDCVTWAQGTMPAAAGWAAVTDSGNQLIAVGTTTNAAVSADGLNWTAVVLASQTWRGIATANALAASSGSIYTAGPITSGDTITGANISTAGATTTGTLVVGTVNAVTSKSERCVCSYNSANLAAAAAFARIGSTNASTLVAFSNMTHDIAGAGTGTFVAKLCSDGVTCAGGNVYLTCTASANCATAAAGLIDACTLTKTAVAAATTLTWSVGTACGTTDPGVNVCACFTTP